MALELLDQSFIYNVKGIYLNTDQFLPSQLVYWEGFHTVSEAGQKYKIARCHVHCACLPCEILQLWL